jgi:hypothetical protein
MKSIKLTVAALLLLAGTGQALADWACTQPKVVQAAYAKGQSLERNGKMVEALKAYNEAQVNACADNPQVAEAAKRAAAVALPLGDAAKAKGDHAAAFDYYERGGHYKAADQALIAWTAVQLDDPNLYQKAFKHFEYRAMPAFRANEALRLAITGSYSLDSSFVARVNAMPAQGVERALIAEAATFNESYLQKRVALVQSRPDNPLDFAAQQQYVARAQVFATQFPKEYLHDSRKALDLVQRWSSATANSGESQAFEKRMRERAQIRVTALTQKYSGDPELLEEVMNYANYLPGAADTQPANVAKIKTQAETLGDAAAAKGRSLMAVAYYQVADADAKAKRLNDQVTARAQAQMQPEIDAAKQSAAAIAAQYSDPNKVAELKRQAQEMQRQMQESAKAKQTPAAKKSRDDLAKELGM